MINVDLSGVNNCECSPTDNHQIIFYGIMDWNDVSPTSTVTPGIGMGFIYHSKEILLSSRS